MPDTIELARAALTSGSCASVASAVALACAGQRDCASAFAPVNAVSHWLWRGHALRQQDTSLRYTLPGYVIHHAMSVLWAVVYEASPGRRRAGTADVLIGLGVAALACFVDLRLTPERLTPGFERRLRASSLFGVYLLFGLGLALPRLLAGRRPGSSGTAFAAPSATAAGPARPAADLPGENTCTRSPNSPPT